MKRLILLVLAAVSVHPALAADGDAAKVARGKYLVTTSGCNDCHTPWHLGPSGPSRT
jgi:mono/diheme cytochrome c family protein